MDGAATPGPENDQRGNPQDGAEHGAHDPQQGAVAAAEDVTHSVHIGDQAGEEGDDGQGLPEPLGRLGDGVALRRLDLRIGREEGIEASRGHKPFAASFTRMAGMRQAACQVISILDRILPRRPCQERSLAILSGGIFELRIHCGRREFLTDEN